MGTRSQGGFTIIETTLFLAITGLLILMITGGVGASLGVQRYRDSVESFKSLIQQQYADLASVQNGRSNQWTCNANSSITPSGASGEVRGQSQCLLVGKYMRIEGKDISIYSVLARKTGSSQNEDIAAMRQDYSMNVSTTDVIEQNLEWGTNISWAKEGSLDANNTPTTRTLGILFIRSPFSGQVYTFTSNSVQPKNAISQSTFTNMISGANAVPGQRERMVCVESGGLLPNGSRGVYIAPYASSANAIETRSNENPASVATGTKC